MNAASRTDVASADGYSLVHIVWFCATFAYGVVFVFVLPPFQTNDEDSHWRRLWTVAQAQVYCHSIPQAATELPEIVHYVGVHEQQHVFSSGYLKKGLEYRGYNLPAEVISTACGYFPAGYVPGAIIARLFALHGVHPRVGGMLRGYYAARLVNWILFSFTILVVSVRLSWFRSTLLFFHAIPEVLQQTVAINLDWFLLSVTALLLICIFDFGSPIRALAMIWCCVFVMAATKPIYAPLVLLGAPLFVTVAASPRRRWLWAIVPLAIFPLFAHRWWTESIPPQTLKGWGVPWIHPDAQIQFLKEHPLHVLTLFWSQFVNTFSSHKLIEGGWTSIIGGFGWSAFEMHPIGYWLVLLAFGAALSADITSAATKAAEVPEVSRLAWRLGWAAATLGILAVVAGIILGMYIYFSRVGQDSVLGVQGRYYHVPLLLLTSFLVFHLRRRGVLARWARYRKRAAGVAAVTLCVANALAVSAIHDFYWTP